MNLADGAARDRESATRSRCARRAGAADLRRTRGPGGRGRRARSRRTTGPGDRVVIVAGNEAAFVAAYLGTLARRRGRGPAQRRVAVARVGARARRGRARARARVRGVRRPRPPRATQPNARARRRRLVPRNRRNGIPVAGRRRGRRGAEPLEFVAEDATDLAVLLFTAGTAGAPKPGDAHARFAAREHRADAVAPGAARRRRRRRARRAPVLPRLRPERRARPRAARGRVASRSSITSIRSRRSPASATTASPSSPASPRSSTRGSGSTTRPHRADAFAHVRLCVSGATDASRADTARGMRERFGVVGARRLRPHRSVAGRHDDRGRDRTAARIDRAAAAGRRGATCSTATATPCSKAIPARSSCAAPNVFAGYWNDPGATAAVLVDGWLHTGDIAVADADGWLTLVDRAKDVIIVSGFNVFPGEVEDALRSHRDVDDVAVIGEPHPRTGETVVAFVVARPGARPIRSSCSATRAASSRATSCRRASRSSTRCRARSRASSCGARCRRRASQRARPRRRRRDDESRVDHDDPDRERDRERLVLTDDALQQSAARQHEHAERDQRVAGRRGARARACGGARTARPNRRRRRTRRSRPEAAPDPGERARQHAEVVLADRDAAVGSDDAVDRRREHHADREPGEQISPARTRSPTRRPRGGRRCRARATAR